MDSDYFVVSNRLTPKTLVHNVMFHGKFVAKFSKHQAANNFAKYLSKNQVTTLNEWRALPCEIRRQFITATSMVEPLLRLVKIY